MASVKNQQTKSQEPEPTQPTPDLSGFDDLEVRADGWWVPSAGAVVYGRIIGYEVMNDGGRFYLVRIAPNMQCDAVKGKGEEAERFKLVEGQIAAVRETTSLRKLRPYIANRGIAYLKVKDKIKLSGQRTMWRFEKIMCRGEPAPFIDPSGTIDSPVAGDVDDDNIPF